MNNETEQIFIINPSEKLQSVASQKTKESPAPQKNLHDVEDFSTVCRTCATVTDFVIPIFEGEGLQNNLAEKICKHLPIQVSPMDVLPLVVCYQCASTLLAWHELVACCAQADAALRTRHAAKQDPETTSEEAGPGPGQQKLPETPPAKTVKVEIEIEPPDPSSKESEPPRTVVGEDGKRYSVCGICHKHVAVGSWRRHLRSHGGSRRHSCALCGLAFSDAGNLARHVKAVHQNFRPHQCPSCFKSFSRKTHLEDHVKSHSESRTFVCDACGKAYKSAASLRMHQKTHDICRFQCMECGRSFKRRGELRAHVTVHTGERAHACGCGRAFRLRAQLTRHRGRERGCGEPETG